MIITAEVDTASWIDHHRELRNSGLVSFDMLGATATMSRNVLQVVSHVMTADGSRRVISRTEVEVGEPLESLTSIYPACAWHEQEAVELVGVVIAARHARSSLLLPPMTEPPLSFHAALRARVARSWPGSYEPGSEGASRRKREKVVPGNRQQWAD